MIYPIFTEKTMSFGGSVAAMVSSLKNNRALISRKSMRDRSRDAFARLGDKSKQAHKLHHREATKEELEYTRRKIEKDNAKQRIKFWVLIGSFSIIAILLFYFAFTYMGVV